MIGAMGLDEIILGRLGLTKHEMTMVIIFFLQYKKR